MSTLAISCVPRDGDALSAKVVSVRSGVTLASLKQRRPSVFGPGAVKGPVAISTIAENILPGRFEPPVKRCYCALASN